MKFLLITIIIIGFLLRIYRIGDLLGFYYDQGRDALIIWDLITRAKLFLIGPTTGIEGIFLGPFYYYLLTPLYFLGKGNPIYPSIFLSLLSSVGLFFLYKLTKNAFGKNVGLFTVFLSAFSYFNIKDQRWLANPNPLTITAIIIFFFLQRLLIGQTKYLPLICLLIGIGLHFEAASAVFFIPSLIISLIIIRKTIHINFRLLFLSVILFFITLLPQLYFDFRHDHILLKSFQSFLLNNKSFGTNLYSIYPARLIYFYESITQRFTVNTPIITPLFFIVFIALILKYIIPSKNLFSKIILIWIMVPLLFLSIYSGNHGYVWDYYLTGIYPLLFILVALSFSHKKLLALLFAGAFLVTNFSALKLYLSRPLTDPQLVTLGTSLPAVQSVYQQANGSEFNVDVYVPPVIAYAYDYLFLWQGATKYKHFPSVQQVSALYTIHEPDGQHPQNLTAWLSRQDSYAKVISSQVYGGITVETRQRHIYEK